MKKMIKRIFFVAIIVSLILATGIIFKIGKFEKLEGYMYSFAMEITDTATDSNATSSNATSSNATSSNATSSNATSSNATSSNATSSNSTSSNATSSNATSSNATSSNATSSNATSSNVTITETIKVTNTQTNTNTQPNANTKPDTNKVEEEKEELEEKIEYNNSEITQEILNKISNSKKTQRIIINVDDNGNINKEVFDAIKGKNIKLTIKVGENEIIFDGNDISTTKTINPAITYNLVSEDILLKEIVDSGVVINFANNGELPGIAKIRIKATNDIKTVLNMDTILVYHYDEEIKELTQLASNAVYNEEEGYIEFSINHNSKYVFVNNLIEEKEYTVTTTTRVKEDNEVSFLESHKMYIMIIGMSVLAIIIVWIIIVIDKKAIQRRKAKANNENKIN